MINIILFFIFNASVFSIEGLGQEQNIFVDPFYGRIDLAQIEFSLRPEFNILNESSDMRGIFWTNPFLLNMKIPVYKGLIFSLGSMEHFNQSFDIYSEKEELKMYVQGRGGIEELYLQLNQSLSIAEVFFRGSYLYGSSREVWNYTIGGYSVADTFLYKYSGGILSAGLKLFAFSCFYEGLGRLNMEKSSYDTTYDLHQILGVGIKEEFRNWKISLLFEYLFGGDFESTRRLKGSIARGNFGFSYAYNPWYLSGIKEHSLAICIDVPIGGFAKFSFNPDFGVRMKGSLREIVFAPQVQLLLEEVFARRRK